MNDEQRQINLEHAKHLGRFKCHKVVSAAKIMAVAISDVTTLQLQPEVGRLYNVQVDGNWVGMHAPQPGGYYVIYEDGYASFSPAKAFEEGYSRIVFVEERFAPLEDGATAQQPAEQPQTAP